MTNSTAHTTSADPLHGMSLEQVKYLFYIRPHRYVAEFGTELPVWPNPRKSDKIGGFLGLAGHPTDEQRAAAMERIRAEKAARDVQGSATGRTQASAKPVYQTVKPLHVVPGTPVTAEQKAAALRALRPRTTALNARHQAALGRTQEVTMADRTPADVVDTTPIPGTPVVENHGGATDPQWSYMEILLTKLAGWNPEQADRMRATRSRTITEGRFTKRTAGAFIDTLKALAGNAPAAPRPELPQIPDGRYALDPVREDSNNSTVFYHVNTNRGYVNVYHQVGPSLVPVQWAMVPAVLRRIEAAGIRASMIRYGRELGVCGSCGRELTNDASRAAGIGPVCANKGA